MIDPFRIRGLTDRAVPTLACVALLQMQMPSLEAMAGRPAPAAETRDVAAAPSPEQNRLQSFVATLYAEGAIERLESCRRWDACLSVTAMFEDFSKGDKLAIARLVRRYFETLPDGGSTVLSVRFLEARTGRELGRFYDNRLSWEPGYPRPL